jgi:hypothetical protein
MREWGVWDWGGFTGLWIAIALSAIDHALKLMPDLASGIEPAGVKARKLFRGLLAFAPLGFLLLATAVLAGRALGLIAPLETVSSPSVVPSAAPSIIKKIFTRTEIEVRQQAIRDLSASMGGPVRLAVLTAKRIEQDGVGLILQRDGPQGLIKRLQDVQKNAKAAFDDLGEVLIKYRPYKEIEEISPNWRYGPIIEKTENYIDFLRIMPPSLDNLQNSMMSPAHMRVRTEWGASVTGFEGWFDQTTAKIRDRNLEYEQAEIR